MQAEFVVPAELGRAERDAFADELFAVHESIFAGVERRAFRAYVVEPDADWTWVLVHRDGGGRLVGYFAGHAYTREVFGRTATVLRGEAGFVRAMRGGNALLRVGFVEAARTMLKSRGRPVYYLGCLVHPVSYYNLAKYMQPVWPSHGTEPTGERLAQLSALGDSFGLRPVGADPLVRHVGWQTRQTEAEAAFWARCPKPSVQYFVQRNPGYGEGHGLLTLTPVSAASLGGAGARMVQLHGRRAAQRLSTRLSQAPLLRGWLGTAEVRRRLRAVPLFQTLDAPALDALARAARQRELPNGHTLVHQGSTGDTLYVVLTGLAGVKRLGVGEVAMLAPGAVVGEVAPVAGVHRTATV
ncbi:MAG: cyclic nucleotide-binding domain-containing protein, partial [Myxococcales bacterium]|nr:cyclic nucleotide-binding domain-containing protein [Myxococcales bacterium]